MEQILSGSAVIRVWRAELKARTEKLLQRGDEAVLATVQVGLDGADASYARAIEKACAATGVRLLKKELPMDCTQPLLEQALTELNADPKVSGILLFRPLPKHLGEAAAAACVSPQKDVDCMTEASLAGVYLGKPGSFAPCTPEACLRILSHYGIDCAGKHAVVLGRSAVVGRPLAALLLRQNATVTVCHSKTRDLAKLCRSADILIAAVGRRHFVDESFVRPGAVVLDVGIHWDPATNQMSGDVDFDRVAAVASAITPVPGGVGSVTSTVLMEHVILSKERDTL